ncbi:MAG TPA: PqqD family protein [Burkholderiales bacterium]|nr:PqqD family protein [Burkholderiales bacterium]
MTIPVKRRDGLILRKVQQDLLLLDTEFNQIHQLNETASFIWENWEQVPDPVEISRLLAQKFDVEEQVVLNDVSAIVGRLQELNLLVR